MGGSWPAGLSGHGPACQTKLNVRPGRPTWQADLAGRTGLRQPCILVLCAVDRFALSIDCSARTIDLSFAHQSTNGRATTDGSRNNRSIVQQAACAINRIQVTLAQSIDSARVRIGAKAGWLDCFAFQCAVSCTRIMA